MLLLGLSIGLIYRHRAVWHSFDPQSCSQAEAEYSRRQHSRRMRTSGLIGVVGVMMFVGVAVIDPLASVIYWMAVLILVCWIALMALADFRSTHVFYEQQRDGFLRERAALDAELKRLKHLKQTESNGEPNSSDK